MTELKKNSGLDSLVNVATGDSVNIRDVSDTTNQATGETKRITQRNLIRWVKGADVASASALPLGADGNGFDITGTTTITSINTIGIGTLILLHFDAILTLTHHATNLILPGGTNITTAAGDEGVFYEYDTGKWRCVNYGPAVGSAKAGANADITSMTALTQITRATGGAFNIAIGGAAGDDFTVDTDKLVVEGDTGEVGIGTTAPQSKLEVQGGVAFGNAIYVSVTRGHLTVVGGSSPDLIRLYDDAELTVPRFLVQRTGKVGIGTVAPGNPLAVNRSADGIIVDFESADVVEGNVSIADNTTSYNAFVGSHYTQLKDGQKELPVGAVIVSTGEVIPCEANIPEITEEKIEVAGKDSFEVVDIEVDEYIEKLVDGKLQKIKNKIGEEFKEYRVVDNKIVKIMKPIYKKIIIPKTQLKKDHGLDAKTGKVYKTIRTEEIVSRNVSGKGYFTYIDTTTKPADKAVYGVWLGKMSDDAKGMSFGSDNKPVYLIAQVGLFKILCTEDGGNISTGDYLETSIHPMLAQKQNSNIKTNSSVAKALVDVDWSKEQINPKFNLKVKLIPCIF